MSRRREQNYNAFGESVSSALADRRMTQNDLATELKVSVGYVNQTMIRKSPSPKWADLVADVLKLSGQKRIELHAAAAKSAGYKLDLTPPQKNKR
jgi:transcriptional regulator with XRE-family HTH domain